MLFTLLIVVQFISLGQVQSCLKTSPPGQLRVALRGPNGVTVSWRTNGFFGLNDTPNPRVAYGTNSELLNAVYSPIGTTSTYDRGSFFHNVALLNLSASTKYFYQIVASSCVRQSNIKSFITAPAAGNLTAVNITLVADLGNDNLFNGGGASRTKNGLLQAALNTNFFIHSGDISYADDYL